jgi:hypothetical protein
VKDAAAIAKEFRDRKRPERIAVSVDMLSTGYNCRDALNIGLMRPVFSPTEYMGRDHTFGCRDRAVAGLSLGEKERLGVVTRNDRCSDARFGATSGADCLRRMQTSRAHSLRLSAH